MVQSTGQKKVPETDSKEMQTFELPDKVCKITVKTMFVELKENVDNKRNQENDG